MTPATTSAGEQLAPEIEPIVLAVLEKRVKERRAAARALLEPLYPEGCGSTPIRSPLDGAKLGTVSRTDPDPEWQIVDRKALHAHLEQDPGAVEQVDEVAVGAEQVLEVLREHAPELLARVERVKAAAVSAALAEAKTGTPVPGIRRVKPKGMLRVTPARDAGVVIDRLVEAKVISWDGTPQQLPAGAPSAPPPSSPSGLDPDCPGCGLPVDVDEPGEAARFVDQLWHPSCAELEYGGLGYASLPEEAR